MRAITALGSVVALLFGFSLSSARAADSTPLNQAMKQAAKDGRPLLVLCGRAECPMCQAYHKRLSTDAALRPLLAHYISVTLNIDSPTSGYRELAHRYPMSSPQLPFVYVLRADGTLISSVASPSSSGPVDAMLREGLAKAGKMLPPKEIARLSAALAKAKEAFEDDNAGQALTLLTPAAKTQGYAEVVVESMKLVTKIKEQATQEVQECEKALGDKSNLLPAAILLAETNRKYAKLPDQRKALGLLDRKLNGDADGRTIQAQAAEIVRARGYVRTHNNDRAVEAYDQIIKKYPDTPAAKLAGAEKKALAEEQHGAVKSADPAADKKATASES